MLLKFASALKSNLDRGAHTSIDFVLAKMLQSRKLVDQKAMRYQT